jgi:phosphoglycolate phosphatase
MSADIQAVFFDLDGTLADTAPDLAYALNQTLEAVGRVPLPYKHIRPYVSHGAGALIQLGFGLSEGEGHFEDHRQHLLEIYRNHICRETRLFPGMEEVIVHLKQRQLRWGIVTNKPAYLTDPLVEAMGLADQACCVISGDTLPQRKPHPAPILLACEQCGVSPETSLYVGDAERDIEAGRRAGTLTLAARFGYLEADERPEDWGADGVIDGAKEIIDWLNKPISTWA